MPATDLSNTATRKLPLLELANLTLGYSAMPAVHHLNAKIYAGSSWALVGPNGGGKTTLLKGIMGELKPLGGKILWPQGKINVGYLPQQIQLNLDLPLSVADFISLGFWQQTGAYQGINSTQQDQLHQALATVGLQDLPNRLIASLSGGQKQRVIFARLLVEDADLLLLDEPFAAVDQATTEQLLEIMQQLQNQGKTLITVLHNLHQVNAYFNDCLFIAREVLGLGKPQEVLTPTNLAKAKAMQTELHSSAAWCELD